MSNMSKSLQNDFKGTYEEYVEYVGLRHIKDGETIHETEIISVLTISEVKMVKIILDLSL